MGTHDSIAITSLFSFLSMVGRIVYEVVSTWTKPSERRINIHLVIISGPVLFLGSFIGVELNTLIPSSVITIGMMIVSIWSLTLSIKQFKKKRAAEKTKDIEHEHEQLDDVSITIYTETKDSPNSDSEGPT